MHFMLRGGWYWQYLEADLKTPLPRKFNFYDVAKVIQMAERGAYTMNLEGRPAIEKAIEIGSGGIFLQLAEEKYAKLKKR